MMPILMPIVGIKQQNSAEKGENGLTISGTEKPRKCRRTGIFGAFHLACLEGFEPATFWFVDEYKCRKYGVFMAFDAHIDARTYSGTENEAAKAES